MWPTDQGLPKHYSPWAWDLRKVLEDLYKKLTEGKFILKDSEGTKAVYFKAQWRLQDLDTEWIEYIPACGAPECCKS